jgi:APA family basic amino acid/polyamine antiporter
VARQHLLPPVLASVHKRFGTPWVATLLSGVATAIIALFTSKGPSHLHISNTV